MLIPNKLCKASVIKVKNLTLSTKSKRQRIGTGNWQMKSPEEPQTHKTCLSAAEFLDMPRKTMRYNSVPIKIVDT